jgi:hypothetical protein
VSEVCTAGVEPASESGRLERPISREQLRQYIKNYIGLDIPAVKICDKHAAPLDYLWHSFNNDFSHARPVGDCVVWANRGGGKTAMAAAATLLDCILKPACKSLILGGSLEQSNRMYGHLRDYIGPRYEDMLAGRITAEQCRFENGSIVEVLTQSEKSVRGRHVNKLRCDEVELFDGDVFTAAQFVTHSKEQCLGSLEILSTMHRPYGLMQKVISTAAQNGTPIFKWCVWEVIEKCLGRTCSQCPLWRDCGGRARRAGGYFKIDDCIAQMQRSSRAAWESEMLCLKPSLENAVFADFDPAIHVRDIDFKHDEPIYRSIDFGFVNPFVCLWIQVDEDETVLVIDEYVRSKTTAEAHGEILTQRTPGGEARVAATYCDPSGSSVNDVTGSSSVSTLKAMGIPCRFKASRITEGIELIRRAVRDGAGRSNLIIASRCTHLIKAMQCYHYPKEGSHGGSELPEKDGVHDHPIDALRYFFVNYFSKASAEVAVSKY